MGNRQRGNGREPASEEAAVAVVTAEPLDVGLETKDEARPRRELIVVADLDAPRPAVATAAASAEAQDPPAERDDRSTGAQEEGGCIDSERVAAEAVAVIAVVPGIAGVHADIEAGPCEDRYRREIGRRGSPREVRGHRPGGEAQKGYRGK